MKFEKYSFSEDIKSNLRNLGFKRPTDIQYKSIPPIMRGEDVLAVAQTGTGKTVAFALPVIQRLVTRQRKHDHKSVRCVVMVPTHELAIQVSRVFEELASGISLKIAGIFGGIDQDPQIERLKQGVDVVVATPGRLFDLESQGYLSLKAVETLILDEADHMLELGFKHDMNQLIRKLPYGRQVLFFSATINKHVKDMAYSLVHKAVRIQISPNDPVSKNIDHSVAFIEMDDKRFFLERIIREHPNSKILVFVRTKVRAERVMKALERVRLLSQTIHSDKDQNQRSHVMEQFSSGENKVLIATDVSARGIDIPDVDIVINYDIPEETENYVHRVGRTGRAQKRGLAIAFCSDEEKEQLTAIEGFLDRKITKMDIEKGAFEETLNMSGVEETNWQALIDEADELKNKKKRKNKKSRK
ncbi:DEAD/DEAH box helicase [Marinilabilia rubra]|uniref:ATP-dependent helicase n=1 Tax=Marinilabilia rubra TaxID=2162893 RepID=A0A2U2B3F0_9BACT|nr:DEAD/DEAH box helicase [Marinilabilia rubra]PWD97592.1 ATP-dependent helicase [Marinilabilia rubra]